VVTLPTNYHNLYIVLGTAQSGMGLQSPDPFPAPSFVLPSSLEGRECELAIKFVVYYCRNFVRNLVNYNLLETS